MYKNDKAADDGAELTQRNGSDFNKWVEEPYERHVDIILGDEDESERWIELKSYSSRGNSGNERYWPASFTKRTADPWNYNTGVKDWQSLHRQFSLDRAAARVGHARFKNEDKDIEIVNVSSDFLWLFQKFNVSKNKTKERKMLKTSGWAQWVPNTPF